jgi:hypothetical protein
MAAERQDHQEFRDMWQRAHHVVGEDMDLMAWVTMGTMRTRHQEEAREAAPFHEAAAAREEADAVADAAAEAACACRAGGGGGSGTMGALGEHPGGGAGAARGGGAPQPEGGAAGGGTDAGADVARAAPPGQPPSE